MKSNAVHLSLSTSPNALGILEKADTGFHQSHFIKYSEDIENHLLERLVNIASKIGRRDANIELLDTSERYFEGYKLWLDADDDEIYSHAKRMVRRCRVFRTRENMERVCIKAGILPPVERLSDNNSIARMRDLDWWNRKLRHENIRRQERLNIELGRVHLKAALYIADDTLQRIVKRAKINRSILEALEAVNENGDKYNLAALQDLSTANPKIRRCELMCRIQGFELIAKEYQYIAEFITLTCPSRMHARHSANGTENKNYDQTSPDGAQKYLCNVWAQIRSKLSRDNIGIFGVRVAEPHHDATPHWHLLLFTKKEHKLRLRKILRTYALKDSPNEPGAQKHRVTFESIDPEKGTATGYIAKYVSKNIDGYGLENIEQGNAKRVRGWASTWGIRQFQQIGGPPVGVWRELRRIHHELSGDLEKARLAADAGNWADYVHIQGVPHVTRKNLRIRALTMWSDQPGRYGEPMGNRVIGITYENTFVISRIHEWKIFRKAKPDATWSTVNNCTQSGRISINLSNQQLSLSTIQKDEKRVLIHN